MSVGCGGSGASGGATAATAPTPGPTTSTGSRTAFLYQTVAPDSNAVRVGSTTDGRSVDTYGTNVLEWQARGAAISYGDPVFSRLPSGRWAMTAWSGPNDPRGSAALLYHEADCPRVDPSAVRVIRPASGSGCQAVPGLVMAKTSQVFEAEGGLYVFTMAGAQVLLVKLADATRGGTALETVCVRATPPSSLAGLGWGEAAVVLGASAAGSLLLSDTAIARRADGTWVLFVKGIDRGVGCSGGGLCELCNRGIYRATSRDLLAWSALERVVDQASVPEAANFPDGSVRLYWQDFGPTCRASDLRVAERAPILGTTEGADGRLGTGVETTFPGEPFQTDTRLHFPTNGNPVRLPDAAAARAFDACFGR